MTQTKRAFSIAPLGLGSLQRAKERYDLLREQRFVKLVINVLISYIL